MDVQADLEALKEWVRELFTHSGAHHSIRPVPVDLTPAQPAQVEESK